MVKLVDKQKFVKKYSPLFDKVPRWTYSPKEVRNDKSVLKIISKARRQLGYSDKTYWLDIFWGLYRVSKSAT